MREEEPRKDPDDKLITHPSLELIDVGDGKIQLFGVRQPLTVDDDEGHVRALLDLCDGTRTRMEVERQFAARLPDGAELVEFLVSTQCISGASELPYLGDQLSAYIDVKRQTFEQYADAATADRGMRRMDIAVIGTGKLAGEITQMLTACGHVVVSSHDASAGFDLLVAAADHLDHEEFRRLNRQAVEAEASIVFAVVERQAFAVGPHVAPHQSACFECYHQRLRSHMIFRPEFDARTRGTFLKRTNDSAIVTQAAAAFATAFVCGVAHENAVIGRPNEIVEVDMITLGSERRNLLKLPRCPVCGAAADGREQPSIYQAPDHEGLRKQGEGPWSLVSQP